ncbi:MAG: hypothetical protein Q8Q08_09710 [Candidatus Omnitrophota bacterium]|nr:hypothetical protein [Candidatus Omnitrophota bacterium]MDZ4242477.1 hypothetical protein [Candidatus Omnitrophota bacterium]
MKKLLILGLLLAFSALPISSVSQADQVSFTVSANVPAATGVAITPFVVNTANPNNATPVAGTTLDFGTLQYDAQNGIYRPSVFFYVDVTGTGGAGNPDVTATYTETVAGNPNSVLGKNGLGKKGTATFTKVTFGALPADTVVTGLQSHGPKKTLSNVNETINETELAGGILRIYLGLADLNSQATFVDPSDAEVFTNTDQPGDYFGTLLVSATID